MDGNGDTGLAPVPDETPIQFRALRADVQTNLHVEICIDFMTKVIDFELSFNKHIVQNFTEKIMKTFAKTQLNLTL